jgi:hypothetical protein
MCETDEQKYEKTSRIDADEIPPGLLHPLHLNGESHAEEEAEEQIELRHGEHDDTDICKPVQWATAQSDGIGAQTRTTEIQHVDEKDTDQCEAAKYVQYRYAFVIPCRQRL